MLPQPLRWPGHSASLSGCPPVLGGRPCPQAARPARRPSGRPPAVPLGAAPVGARGARCRRVLSTAVAVAAEGSHATCTAPILPGTTRLCPRGPRVCHAVLRPRPRCTQRHPGATPRDMVPSASPPSSRVRPRAAARDRPGAPPPPGCERARSRRPAPPSAPRQLRALGTGAMGLSPTHVRRVERRRPQQRADVGSPRGPPSAAAVGGVAEGASEAAGAARGQHRLPEPPPAPPVCTGGGRSGSAPPGHGGSGGWSQGFPGAGPSSGPPLCPPHMPEPPHTARPPAGSRSRCGGSHTMPQPRASHTQRGSTQTRRHTCGHACTGTRVRRNTHTHAGACTHAWEHTRVAAAGQTGLSAGRTACAHTPTPRPDGENHRTTPAPRGCASVCATVPAGPTALQRAVRGGGSVSSPPCPRVTVCFGMNHTPSPCLGFPTGAGGRGLSCRRGARQSPAARSAWGSSSPPRHTGPHTQLCTRVHTQGTHAISRMRVPTRTRSARGQRTQHPHLSPHAHPPCTHVCDHTHVGITRVCPLGPPVPAACAWAPRQLCAPAAPRCSVSLATLRIYQWRHCGKTLQERREEGGGGSVGAGGGQTGGRGGPWCSGGAVCTRKADAQACVVGLRCAHACAKGAAN